MAGSLLDLGPAGRTIACAVFFGSEVVLIATAGMRSDRSYGFRMFPESSTIAVHLSRRLADGTLEPVESGRWTARDCSGKSHVVVWNRLVHSPAPSKLDAWVAAPYGVESEIHRLRDGMRWVLGNVKDDCETRALVAKVKARRNDRHAEDVVVEVARDPGAGDAR